MWLNIQDTIFVSVRMVEEECSPSRSIFYMIQPHQHFINRDQHMNPIDLDNLYLPIYRTFSSPSFPRFSFFLYTPDFWRGCTTFPPCNYVIGRGISLIYVFELSFYLQVSEGRARGARACGCVCFFSTHHPISSFFPSLFFPRPRPSPSSPFTTSAARITRS